MEMFNLPILPLDDPLENVEGEYNDEFNNENDVGSEFGNNVEASGYERKSYPRSEKYRCMECNYPAHSKVNLTRHCVAVHKMEKPFSCEHCEFRCSRKDNLTSHMKHNHLPRHLTCEYENCNYATNEPREIQRHVNQVHLKLTQFSCTRCDYTATRKDNVDKHEIRVHDQKEWQEQQGDLDENPNMNNVMDHFLKKEDDSVESKYSQQKDWKPSFSNGSSNLKLQLDKIGIKTDLSREDRMVSYTCPVCETKYMVNKEIIEFVRCKHCFLKSKKEVEKPKFDEISTKLDEISKSETASERRIRKLQRRIEASKNSFDDKIQKLEKNIEASKNKFGKEYDFEDTIKIPKTVTFEKLTEDGNESLDENESIVTLLKNRKAKKADKKAASKNRLDEKEDIENKSKKRKNKKSDKIIKENSASHDENYFDGTTINNKKKKKLDKIHEGKDILEEDSIEITIKTEEIQKIDERIEELTRAENAIRAEQVEAPIKDKEILKIDQRIDEIQKSLEKDDSVETTMKHLEIGKLHRAIEEIKKSMDKKHSISTALKNHEIKKLTKRIEEIKSSMTKKEAAPPPFQVDKGSKRLENLVQGLKYNINDKKLSLSTNISKSDLVEGPLFNNLKQHKCQKCPFEAKWIIDLNKHLEDAHNQKKTFEKYVCKLCFYATSYKENYSAHMERKHPSVLSPSNEIIISDPAFGINTKSSKDIDMETASILDEVERLQARNLKYRDKLLSDD